MIHLFFECFFDCRKRAIVTKRIQSFFSPSSLSPSTSYQFLRVTRMCINFKGGTPGVDLCIIFTRIYHWRASSKIEVGSEIDTSETENLIINIIAHARTTCIQI